LLDLTLHPLLKQFDIQIPPRPARAPVQPQVFHVPEVEKIFEDVEHAGEAAEDEDPMAFGKQGVEKLVKQDELGRCVDQGFANLKRLRFCTSLRVK